jgi:hypothetical protein
MPRIEFGAGGLNATVRNLGLAAGILESVAPDKLALILDWFQDPLPFLRDIPKRRQVFLPMLREHLGAELKDPPKPDENWKWYPLDRDRAPNGVFVVLPAADNSGDSSTIGLGVRARVAGAGVADAYLYLPLFTLPLTTPNPVVLGSDTHPIRFWLNLGTTDESVKLDLSAEVRFNGAPRFQLSLKVDAVEKLVRTLAEVKSDPVRGSIKAALGTDFVKAWLGKQVGDSGLTVGDFLEKTRILAKEGTARVLAPLDQFNGATPIQIAQTIIADVLTGLAGKAALNLGKSGKLEIASRDAGGGATDLGFRVVAPDITTRKSDTTAGIVVQGGKWLSNDRDENRWVRRDNFDPGKTIGDPGVLVTLLRATPSGSARTLSFRPALELISVGFDVVGPKGKPLFDIGGFSLQALEARYYFRLDFTNTSAIDWGGAISCKSIGVPLGTGAAGTVKNPVVQNLLSAGKKGPGSDNQPANPTFSATAARIMRSGATTTMALWLDPSQGTGDESEVSFPIQRSFGPLRVSRVTVQWPRNNPKNVLTFKLDANVTIQSLAVSLTGFSVGVPLASAGQLSSYDFALAGLGVSFQSGSLSIEAALIQGKEPSGATRYDGKAVIRASSFSLAALGSYTVVDGAPSMFVFAFLRKAIGGPSFCFVTGICAGFGYNRSLRLPDRDKVNEFPLLAALDDPKAIGGENASPDAALKILNDGKWVVPSHGTHWIAAGLQFTTYELVRSNAILFVLFGSRTQIALLGVSRMRLPQGDTGRPFAYAELGLQVTLDLDDGFFAATAILSPNSYVLDPACKLTGGFAMFAWFGGQHGGDFVLTLGGYHPAFVVPAHYPRVPRLGFSWQVNDNVTVSGQAYFAITPTCAMGGGMLQVQFHAGDLRAWFLARADFLLQWKPFFYSGLVAVSIGASYRLNLWFTTVTISVELGASLEIWGPPTGGRVEIDWYIISFSVSFGAPRPAPPAMDWDRFDQLLPRRRKQPQFLGSITDVMTADVSADVSADNDPAEICTITFSDGVMGKDGDVWLARPAAMELSLRSVIPATEINLRGAQTKTHKPTVYQTISVRGMNKKDVQSIVDVTLTKDGGGTVAIDQWNGTPAFSGAPRGMWGEPLPLDPDRGTSAPPPLDPETLPNRLFGVNGIRAPLPVYTGPEEFPRERVAYEQVVVTGAFLPLQSDAPDVVRTPRVDDQRITAIAGSIASTAKDRRAQFAAVVAQYGVTTNDAMSSFASNATTLLVSPPLAGRPWETAT